jgi:hypothetical protein
MVSKTGEGEDFAALRSGNLTDEVGCGTETVDAQALRVSCGSQ